MYIKKTKYKNFFTTLAISTMVFLFVDTAYAKFSISTVDELVGYLIDIITPISAIIVLIITLLFFWNIFKIGQTGGAEGAKQAKTKIIAGVATLFMLVSVFGITFILIKTLNSENSSTSQKIEFSQEIIVIHNQHTIKA